MSVLTQRTAASRAKAGSIGPASASARAPRVPARLGPPCGPPAARLSHRSLCDARAIAARLWAQPPALGPPPPGGTGLPRDPLPCEANEPP